jgi:hypothetical protein
MAHMMVRVSKLVMALRMHHGEPLEPGLPFRVGERAAHGIFVIESMRRHMEDAPDPADGSVIDPLAIARATRDYIFTLSEAQFWEHEFLLHYDVATFLLPYIAAME